VKHGVIVPLAGRDAEAGPLAPELVERAARELAFLQIRRRRLPSRRLSDAQWAILLDLYVAQSARRRVYTGDLAGASGVPVTTLLRYLEDLERRQMIVRTPAEHDRRVTLVTATERGLARIASILSEVAQAEQRRDPPIAEHPPPRAVKR
jgi:DNA-binding MarR family transcriptional regulator